MKIFLTSKSIYTTSPHISTLLQPDLVSRNEWNCTVPKCMLPQTGTCSYDSTSNAPSILNKTIFLWEGHTENRGKSFNMLYDIVDLFLDPALERLLSQLQAKWAMLNSWVWRVTGIKPRQSKSNLLLFIITNWWMHLLIFWSKQGSWCVTSLFLKKFALPGFLVFSSQSIHAVFLVSWGISWATSAFPSAKAEENDG